VLFPNIALEIVAALEEVIGSTASYWTLVEPGGSGTLESHSGPVNSVDFSPDSKQIVSGSWDRTLRLWDAATGAALPMPKEGPLGLCQIKRQAANYFTCIRSLGSRR
jgi:WD40 repeat protein